MNALDHLDHFLFCDQALGVFFMEIADFEAEIVFADDYGVGVAWRHEILAGHFVIWLKMWYHFI